MTDSSGVSSIQPLNADKGIPVDLLPKIDTLEWALLRHNLQVFNLYLLAAAFRPEEDDDTETRRNPLNLLNCVVVRFAADKIHLF